MNQEYIPGGAAGFDNLQGNIFCFFDAAHES
jgi:hypothetical protein